jgi:putative membrane protein
VFTKASHRLGKHEGWLVRVLLAWAATAVALKVADWAFDRFWVSNWSALLVAAAVYALVNTFLKPIATFLTLPLILVTLGVAYFFVNMLMLWLTVQIVSGFEIDGFWTYVGATIVVALVNWLVRRMSFPGRKSPGRFGKVR